MSQLVNTEKVKRAILVISMAALMLSTPVIMPMIYNMGVQFGWWSSNSIANDVCLVNSFVGWTMRFLRFFAAMGLALYFGGTPLMWMPFVPSIPILSWALFAWSLGCM